MFDKQIKEQNTLISIIIPCYNQGQYIDDAINSVEEYEKDDYEIIIINDGSTDDFTNKRLNELKNEGYDVIFQENQGLGRTRNNGLKLAKGKYILPLDADNKIKPEYITKAIEILEANLDISIVYSDRQNFGTEKHVVVVEEFSWRRMLIENYIDACAVYRKSMWEEIGGYDENMPVQGYEDWDFWLCAAKHSKIFYYIPEPLFFYRIKEDSMLKSLNRSKEKEKLILYIYTKHIQSLVQQYQYIYQELYKCNSYINYYKKLQYYKLHPLSTSIKYFYRWIISLST